MYMFWGLFKPQKEPKTKEIGVIIYGMFINQVEALRAVMLRLWLEVAAEHNLCGAFSL